jgi:hypothetical protein
VVTLGGASFFRYLNLTPHGWPRSRLTAGEVLSMSGRRRRWHRPCPRAAATNHISVGKVSVANRALATALDADATAYKALARAAAKQDTGAYGRAQDAITRPPPTTPVSRCR